MTQRHRPDEQPRLTPMPYQIDVERLRALERLEAEGYDYVSQNSNFFFIRPRRPVAEVKAALHGRGILVKSYSYELLRNYIRISTGSRRVMEHFLDVFLEVDNQ